MSAKAARLLYRHQVERITHEDAIGMLGTMERNRALKPARVREYAGLMIRGEFDGLNGQAIGIDWNGRLINGQHRLHALLESGTPYLETLVIRGLAPKSQDTVDEIAPRTGADLLRFNGHPSSTALAAAARWLWIYENTWPLGLRNNGGGMPRAMVPQVATAHPELGAAEVDVRKHYPRATKIMSASIAVFVRAVTREISASQSDYFFHVMDSGAGGDAGRTIRLLRDKFLARRSTRNARLSPAEMVALTVLVWNAFRRDRHLTKLYAAGKNVSEPFSLLPKFE